jgi:predicted ATPase
VSETVGRFEAATHGGLAALVGRHSEVSLLQDRWAQVVEGTGQVVCLSGEAGIGKSRLVHMLRSHVLAADALCLSASGEAYHQSTALNPIIDLVQDILGFERSDEASTRLAKLHQGLAKYGLGEARMPGVFAALLSLPGEAGQPAAPAGTQKETLEAILTLLLALAARKPVLLVVEDLHWLDPSTLELLGLLIDQVPTANFLLLTAARPSFQPPWGARPHINALRLGRLTRTEIGQLVLQVTGGKPLPAEVLDQIIKKTDGVPLFVEELTKTVLELGLLQDVGERYELIGPLAPLAIPATVHDSLMARLDRLSTAKTVAQLGAVVRSGQNRRGGVAPVLAAAGGGRGLAAARLAAERKLHIQACAGARRRLRLLAAQHAPSVPPARGPGSGGKLCYPYAGAARGVGLSLHRGRPRSAGDSALAASGAVVGGARCAS